MKNIGPTTGSLESFLDDCTETVSLYLCIATFEKSRNGLDVDVLALFAVDWLDTKLVVRPEKAGRADSLSGGSVGIESRKVRVRYARV